MFERWREPRELKYEKVLDEPGSQGNFPPLPSTDPDRLLFDHPSCSGAFVRKVGSETWNPVLPLPNVILVTDRVSRHLHSGLMPLHRPEDLGYRFVERVWEHPATRYVRGRWLWCLHKAGCWLWRLSRPLAWWGVPEAGPPRF